MPDVPLLDAAEQRLLRSLLEKQVTVPASYPLSLNSLRTACNQASSREPVTDYDEQEVERVARGLKDRGLVRIVWADTGRRTLTFTVRPLAYVDEDDLRDWTRTIRVKPGRSRTVVHSAADAHGWYDLVVTADEAGSFRRRLMGHIENGRASVSG